MGQISLKRVGLLHEGAGRPSDRMAPSLGGSGSRGRTFHLSVACLGVRIDRATSRSTRSAQTIPFEQQNQQHDHRPAEKAAVVVIRQSEMGGLQRAALRGPAQGGDAGGLSCSAIFPKRTRRSDYDKSVVWSEIWRGG